ncbi:response regulator [Phytopseudomonas daroniae]|uniref:response regulator n=1 Tax=Pseudomonadaceae TaxID=135621 RepID=UPI0013F17417|nr:MULTISPECIES: response regulator [Pseudomonas]
MQALLPGESFQPFSRRGVDRNTDDNPVNLKLVSPILDRLRHIRLVTMHAPEKLGIEFALAHQPDLIMLDINLPGMEGYQAVQVFQSHLQLRHVPVIAVSANAMHRDIERGMAAGFADYLTKPLDIGRFLASVDAHLPDTIENRAMTGKHEEPRRRALSTSGLIKEVI